MSPDQALHQEVFRPIIIYGIPIFGLTILLIANYIQCWRITHEQRKHDPIFCWYLVAVLTGVIINMGMAHSLKDQITSSYHIQQRAMEVLKETNAINASIQESLADTSEQLKVAWPELDYRRSVLRRFDIIDKKLSEME